MSRPKIAFVTPTLDVMGGTEQIAGLEARALTEVADVTFFTKAAATRQRRPGVVSVATLPLPGIAGMESWFHAASHAVRRHPRRFDAVYSPGINCDCATHINVYANFSEWLEKHRGVPLQRSPTELHRRLLLQRMAAWERRIYRDRSVRLATISRLAAKRLADDFARDDIAILPSTPEPGRFTPAVREQRREATRRRMNLRPDAFVILLVGNAWYSKGMDILFAALRPLDHDITPMVVTTETQAHVEQFTDALPTAVRWLPRQRAIEDLYAAADVVVLPSRGETFGLPIAEAGAMDVPVLVSAHAGVSDYVPEACVVHPNTASAWRTAIDEIRNGRSIAPETVTRQLQTNDPNQRATLFVDWVLGG